MHLSFFRFLDLFISCRLRANSEKRQNNYASLHFCDFRPLYNKFPNARAAVFLQHLQFITFLFCNKYNNEILLRITFVRASAVVV